MGVDLFTGLVDLTSSCTIATGCPLSSKGGASSLYSSRSLSDASADAGTARKLHPARWVVYALSGVVLMLDAFFIVSSIGSGRCLVSWDLLLYLALIME